MRAASHPFTIFIGYDSREPIAYHVLAHSILTRARMPIAIAPLARESLPEYTRERGPLESTDFSISRFLVPYLSNYEGWSLFMDCDMLCRVDMTELLLEISAQRDKAVLVCQHDYTPTSTTKFLNQPQTAYPRKNWSSFMVFNNKRCKSLTTKAVNEASGLFLHRFEWLNDFEIGTLPLEWNWLVGEYPKSDDAKVLHFTTGGPWFHDCTQVDNAGEWRREYARMVGIEGLESIDLGMRIDAANGVSHDVQEYVSGL